MANSGAVSYFAISNGTSEKPRGGRNPPQPPEFRIPTTPRLECNEGYPANLSGVPAIIGLSFRGVPGTNVSGVTLIPRGAGSGWDIYLFYLFIYSLTACKPFGLWQCTLITEGSSFPFQLTFRVSSPYFALGRPTARKLLAYAS